MKMTPDTSKIGHPFSGGGGRTSPYARKNEACYAPLPACEEQLKAGRNRSRQNPLEKTPDKNGR